MNALIELFSQNAERLGWAVIHSLWQGAIAAVALGFVLRLLRHRSAAARHGACLVAMLTMLFAAVLTVLLIPPQTASHHLPRLAPEPRSTMPGTAELSESRASSETATFPDDHDSARVSAAVRPTAMEKPWRERFTPLLSWIAGAWLLGVLVLSLRHCGSLWHLRALRRRAVTMGGEVQRIFVRLSERFCPGRVVGLLESAETLAPMLTGILKPIVLLPARVVTGLSAVEIEAILAHELAHLVRRDAWSNLAQVVIETLLFYHPAVWWIGRCARWERENAADDLALEVCADRRVYAGALAHLAEMHLNQQAALAATGGSLLARIQRIVRPAPVETPPSGWSVGIPAFLIALVLVAVVAARAQETKPINVKPGESIQAAIDAAPAGAVIRLGEGEWKERIDISKPITLEGAGWEKTRITIEEPPTAEIGTEFEKTNAGAQATATPEAADAARIEQVRRARRPAIFAHSANGVNIRGLRVQGASKLGTDSGLTISTLVYFYNTKAAMTRCVVAGPFGQGIRISGGADVEVRDSLVAAIWDVGIAVLSQSENSNRPVSRLHLVDSEVRNVYHYGITIGPGCNSTVIERCRISGSAWHGVRYDAASPTITDNTIFQNARFGIYASGKTAATVRGNLIWKNDMEGIWCLSGNADTIEGNTFVGNKRGGIAVSGAKPKLAHNIIAGSPIGVSCSIVSGQSAPGDPSLDANLFWETPIALQVKDEQKPAPDGSLTTDPQFRDPGKANFALAPASPARAANIGVAEPLTSAGPWALLAEEKSIIPADETRESSFWSAPGAAKKSRTAAVSDASTSKDTESKPEIEVQWKGQWWPATILKKDGERTQIHYVGYGSEWDEWVTQGRVRPLAAVAASADAQSSKTDDEKKKEEAARLVERNRQAARLRAADDRQKYQPSELSEIESLYQVANKNWRSEEARTSLKKLLEKYDHANRTGCATLYMGQMSEGQERIDYLTRAVEKFSDCYYFNGCQVGGYGRYVLALTLWDKGEKDKARALIAELKTTYKDATDHRGRPITDLAEAAEKGFAAQQ